MNTATPAPDNITAAKSPTPDAFALGLVRWATEYAMHASPQQLDRQMHQAYGDLVPGSAARHRAVEADLAGRLRGGVQAVVALEEDEPERHLVPCLHCGQPFEFQWPATRQMFCSPRCQRRVARLRHLAKRPTGDAGVVQRECSAALARFRALLVEEITR